MVIDKVEALLANVELDPAGETRAEIAYALARQLDFASGSVSNGAMAMAVPAISKELRAVLDSILEGTTEDEEFIADLYAEVGNS